MLAHILIAVAEDEIAERVIDAGTTLAKMLGARVALVDVVALAVARAVAAEPMAEGGSPGAIGRSLHWPRRAAAW